MPLLAPRCAGPVAYRNPETPCQIALLGLRTACSCLIIFIIKTIKTILTTQSVLASVITLGLMIYAGQGWEQGMSLWFGFLASSIWAVSPYGFMILSGFLLVNTITQLLVVLICSILIILFGIVIYYDGFFIHIDAQNALLFVFVPLYQWIGCGIYIGLASLIGRKKRSL